MHKHTFIRMLQAGPEGVDQVTVRAVGQAEILPNGCRFTTETGSRITLLGSPITIIETDEDHEQPATKPAPAAPAAAAD